MKKTLIALAALAVVGVASAQSSVTLYGVVDAAIGAAGDPQIAGSTLGPNLANDKFQVISSNNLNNGNSRFGMRGAEDLGGGLKAGFNLEGGVVLGTGAGNTSGGNLFSRAANVSLMTNMGTLQLGRGVTTTFDSIASWELTGTANYSVVANQFSFGGVGPRDSNVIRFNSANYSGLSVSASYIPKGNANFGTAADPKDKYDLAVTFARGPITASAAYNRVTDGNEGTVVGVKFDLGTVQVAASYNNVQANDSTLLARGFSLGASAGVGPVTLTADVARDTTFNDNDYVLEAKYALSKRTFIYAVYMVDGGRAVGTDLYKGVPVAYAMGHLNVNDVNGYSLGIRHNF